MSQIPFRFGLSVRPQDSPGALAEQARWAEDHGFSTLLVADHLRPELLDPMPALAAAAAATSRLRVGTFVINNDLRHPALLAREAVSVDLLSGGRFELGIGAGHMQSEYDEVGIGFDRGRVRVDRLEESVQILKALLAGEECTFDGRFYKLRGHRVPDPAQKPRIPLLIGGNGPRVHRLAAAEADAVGFVGFSHRQGGQSVDTADMVPAALDRQVAQVREAAGARALELNALVQHVAVTDNPRRAAEEAGAGLAPDADTLLASPYFLFGSVDSIIEQLSARRDRFGISYWVVFERRGGRDLAPAVERLAGT